MIDNIKNITNNNRIYKIDSNFVIQTNIDSIIGRTAHIKFLDN